MELKYCLVNNEVYTNIEYYIARKKSVLDFLKPFLDFGQIKNVLDYGGDKGQYIPDQLSDANKYVYDISGNQTVPNVTLLRTLNSVKQIKWDFILCMHLLEHLSDPLDTLKTLSGLLGGGNNTYLYIELPKQDYMHRYSDIEINEHINFFQENTMYKIGDLFKLRIINMKIESTGIIRVLYQKM